MAEVTSEASCLSLKHTMNCMMNEATVVTIRTTRFVVQPSKTPKLRNMNTIETTFAPVSRAKNIIKITAEHEHAFSPSISIFFTSLSLIIKLQTSM